MSELDLFLLILRQLCFGSLISGFIIFLLTLFIQGSHLFDHDHDFDHDLDHDMALESEISVGIDKDISVGIDKDISVGIDKDVTVGFDKDVGVGVDKHIELQDHHVDTDTPAPLMLLLGTFMITFGGSGTILIDSPIHPFISILITLGLPVVVTFLVSKLWAKIAIDETYETALETINIDDAVMTLTTVDTKGGLVVIETSSVHGPVKLAARTKFGAIPKNMTAYVVEINGNTLIIDEWPTKEGKEKPIPEGQITWE